MERDYREESWWPQPLLERWYLTDSDRFEISTTSVGEEGKRRASLKRLTHWVQVPGWTLGPPLTSQSSSFVWACMNLLLRMGQNQKGQAWIYILSVLLLLYTEIYRSMQRLLENLRQSFLISQSYKKTCAYFSLVHPLLTGTVASFIQVTVLFTCSSISSISNCSFCLKCLGTAF